MEQRETYIAVDLGGTKLLLGEIDRQGNVLRTRRWPTGALTQSRALELIESALDEFLGEEPPERRPLAIGLGLVGRIDGKTGRWLEIDHDRKEEIPLGEILEARYHLPCFADNDVRSATKAEMLFGRGQDTRHLIYINVGTGIAAGFVTDGKLIRGGNCNAGEVGHTASGIDFHAPCACGRPDCVEPVASGLGFDTSARILAKRYPDTKLSIPEGVRVSAADVFALYDTDEMCRVLVDNAAQALANLIMNLTRVTDPETVVLGGGVMSGGFLYEKILSRLNAHTMRFVTGGVVRTALDPRYIGLLGAGSNAIYGLEEEKE